MQRDLGTPPVEGGSRSPARLRGQQLQGQERPHVSAHLPAISRQSPNRAEEEEPSEAPAWGQPPAAAPQKEGKSPALRAHEQLDSVLNWGRDGRWEEGARGARRPPGWGVGGAPLRAP